MISAEDIKRKFLALFDDEARIFRAPGRVNLIGEHTDYNDGFVMPAAIDLCAFVACAPRKDRKVAIRSENFSETAEFDLDDANARPRKAWSDYAQGVALTLEQAGYALRGANLFIQSEVPVGAGLSSSAAIEIAVALALLDAAHIKVEGAELARLCQRAENDFAGARVGIMDQFASLHGRAGCALMLDCRSLDYRLIALPERARLAISNTMVKHELASGEYNARRAQCEEGARMLQKFLPGARSLRDVSVDEFERYGQYLPETLRKRCRHVITENRRVELAAEAIERGDLKLLGQLMRESHESLRDDYEVSCREMDIMVELARQIEGAHGARMTGGGFGGSAISIVEAARVEEFKKALARDYEKAAGLRPEIYICSAAEGASAWR